MPLLIGLHKSLEERARRIWGEELVLVDLDNDEMQVCSKSSNVMSNEV